VIWNGEVAARHDVNAASADLTGRIDASDSGWMLARALASRLRVSVTCKLGQDVLDSLHAQLRLLAALAPDAVAILDRAPFR